MSPPVWLRTFFALTIAAIIAGCIAPPGARSRSGTKRPTSGRPRSRGGKEAPARQNEFVGRVEAIEKVEIRARVQGFLVRRTSQPVPFEPNQILFTIEKEPFEATLKRFKAQLAGAEATLANASATLRRYRELESKQVASQAQLDVAVAENHGPALQSWKQRRM